MSYQKGRMAHNRIDLKGKLFGIVRVLRIDPKHNLKESQACWRVQCEACRHEWTARGSDLRRNKVTACRECGRKPAADYTGKTFGLLNVLKRAAKGWRCKCECGRTVDVLAANLPKARSCGCLRRTGRMVDIAGQRFDRLTVERMATKRIHGHVAWHVRCDCGTRKVVDGNLLRRGNTRSFRCCRRRDLVEMVGKTFGHVKVEALRPKAEFEKSGASYDCRCTRCGRSFVATGGNLRNGSTVSCGCYRRDRMAALHRRGTSVPATNEAEPLSANKRRRGAPTKPDTQRMHEICYMRMFVDGASRRTILKELQGLFGESAPKEPCEVKTYAKRYARKHKLPLARNFGG
jgi:hypothetical protein